MSITISQSDVNDALGSDGGESHPFEIKQAQRIVNRELEPYTSDVESLELTGALMAAAYAQDDGNGQLSSITQGSAQISYTPESEDALSYWRRAIQMDPTGRLESLEEGDFWSVTV